MSHKTVTKSYVFNRTCKKDIYLLKTLSAPLRRVDGPKEYVNPGGVLPVISLKMHLICPPMTVYEGGPFSVKNGI